MLSSSVLESIVLLSSIQVLLFQVDIGENAFARHKKLAFLFAEKWEVMKEVNWVFF